MRVPFALNCPAGDVRGDGAGERVTTGVGDGEGVGVGAGPANKLGLSTTNAEITTMTTTRMPIIISILRFFALVCGLFLPHSGLSWFLRNLRERGMSRNIGQLVI